MEEQEMAAAGEETGTVEALWDSADVPEDQSPGEGAGEAPAQESGEGQPPGGEEGPAPVGEGPQAPAEPEAAGSSAETAPAQSQVQESFTLQTLDGSPKTVGREEVLRLAQQGLGYERIRQERDNLRSSAQESEQVLELVKGFAQRSGMTVQEYVDYCRVQELVAQGVNESTARTQVALEKREATVAAQEEAQRQAQARVEEARQQAQAEGEARRKDMLAFLEAYPEVEAGDIPKAVWDRVAAGESLVTAYTMEQNRQLRAQLAAAVQNAANVDRAPGSMSTRGQKDLESIDDYWDEAGV